MSYLYDINERFYKVVAASSSETDDYVPANGENVFLVNAGLSSSTAPQTSTCIIWDADGTPEVVVSSYGEVSQDNINKTFVGDGVKVMRICLTNDLTESTYMGGFWQADKI